MNNNCIKKKIAKNWNTIVLPIEEIILTRTPEEACFKKIITPSLNIYTKNMEKNISFYSEDKEFKNLLKKRLICIKNFVKLKKILANNPSTNEQTKNNFFLRTERNTLKQLTKELINHSRYIQTHRMRLVNRQISEDHIQPLIFNILAEAFNHLAELDWNTMKLNPINPNPKKFNASCLDVLNAYEARLKYLKEEKKCLSNIEMRALCDEKILNTLKNIDETISDSSEMYRVQIKSSKKESEKNSIKDKSQIQLKQPCVIGKKRLGRAKSQINHKGSFFKLKQAELSVLKSNYNIRAVQ